MLLGYARISTVDQNPVHQIDALRRGGVEEDDVYVDVASGAKARRPKFDLVMKLLRDGDTLKVTRLDRLGRSVVHLVTLGAELRARRRPARHRAGHRHLHPRGPGHVRDAVRARRATARA